MKRIKIAGGSRSRLYPCTMPGSKQLLPAYREPIIGYQENSIAKATPVVVAGFVNNEEVQS